MKLTPPLCIAALLIVTLTTPIRADTPPPTASAPNQAALIALIKGNSTSGRWAGTPYLQYFAPNGATRYQEEGRRPSEGTWRVSDSGQYCSIWPPSSNETCYPLAALDRDIYWRSGETYYRATVVDGNIFQQR